MIIFFVAGSFVEVMLAPAFPLMKPDLSFTYSALGLLMATMFVVGNISQIAWGFVLDRRNPSFAMAGGLGALVLGVALLVSTPYYGVSITGAAFMGAGMKCLPLVGLIILVRNVPQSAFGRWYFFPLLLGPIGYSLTPVAVVFLAYNVGWRFGFVVLVMAIATLCGTLTLLCIGLPVTRHEPARASARAVGFAFDKSMILIFFGIVLATTTMETQLLKGSYDLILHQYTEGSIEGFRARAMATQHVTASILMAMLGLIVSAFVADFTGRPGLWIGGGLAVSAFASLLLVVMQQLPDGVILVVFSIFWFTLAAVKIPVVKLFIQLLPPSSLGVGVAALFVIVDFISWRSGAVGEWLAGKELSSNFSGISACIFGLASGILFFYSRRFEASGEKSSDLA